LQNEQVFLFNPDKKVQKFCSTLITLKSRMKVKRYEKYQFKQSVTNKRFKCLICN